ncbi:MAG: LamG-like jellyroll fold domain-containing protein, partial [Bacteroidota bacterium]
MKRIIHYFILLFVTSNIIAQQTGDTIFVKAFKYGSNTRDTMINFPSGNTTYEKIILKYNMRCKNNLISTQAAPNQGCGEWDYSCNTYVVDSSKIENALFTNPNYIVSNFTGSVFPYTSQALFDYYNFAQTNVTLNSITSENQYSIGIGSVTAANVVKANEKSGRSQLLFTASELSAAGLTAGNINGFLLNVVGIGGTVNFLKIGVQQTTLSSLSSATATVGGFTNYYNSNFTFTTGVNRVQFPAPAFVWNGTSNILIDISFTNTNPNNPIVFNGSNTGAVMALYTNNNYALDVSALGHVVLNAPSLSNISNQITVAFWAFGNSNLLPSNTSMLYGYDNNPNNRNFNLHLPWSNSNMYFDCGFANGGYDRINKAALSNEISGQWNHWAFTKNAVSGDMKIYLNGQLWHSGTALTKTISILTMILGKDNALQNNWKGKLNELSIWNKELSLSDIQNWMNKPIDNTHPFYSNLMAYYKLNEGNGQIVLDSKNNLSSTGVNLQWTYDRGNNLFKSFYESNTRPNIVFVRGTYNISTNNITVKDSIKRNPNVVQQYSITSNAGVNPMTDDQVVLVSTQNLYQTSPILTYNGDTGVLTSTTAVSNFTLLNITDLPYFKRYPYFNEIMSFVTPYGKGLSLGANGKSWYYDVSDFAPILKGKKRLLITLGGENQEQMDLDFWFIVGTPPLTVLQYDQLWQGAARAGGAGIASINNDSRFAVLTQSILANAQSFKLRSTITGHGAQGEFSQNGGNIYHNFNIAGGSPEFTWQVTQKCSDNPMIAQGGTWVYPRQGWCPGQASLLKEYNLTPFITPGNTVTLDYGCSNPPNISGDYRYIVANQFINLNNTSIQRFFQNLSHGLQ